jgi:hypothetical protein
MDKIFNINLNGVSYEIQDRPLTEQVATLEGEVAGKLDATAYTPYDDTQVKADIQDNKTAIAGKQDKGNYALQGDSYTKAESDAKYLTEHQSLTAYAKVADVNAELAKKQDKGDYALKSEIPSVEGLASETYVSDKIKEVVGTAPEALDTLGEIADKLSGDDDAIAAINQVLDGKVSKDEYNTNQQSINNSLTDLSNNKADKSDVYTKTEVDSKLSEKLDVTAYTPTDMSNYYTKTESDNKLTDKQDALVSGTNVKTINGESILGEGNITIENDTDLTDYYTKTEIDNMVGDINNALNLI